MKIQFKSLLLCFVLILMPSLASAGEKNYGKYTIHYSTFSADFLTPEIAKTYGIQRSKNRSVLNITVTENQDGGLPKPVQANIDVTGVNQYQKIKRIKLRKIVEDKAIYYISEFPVGNQEIIHFKINADKDGKVIGKLKFQQTFYIDP